MYAVVATGGKQYRVEAGTLLEVELLAAEVGSSVTFDRVLMIGDGEQVMIGTPLVPGASVSATLIAQTRGPKIVIFKFKQKVKYRRRTGHRQHLTQVRIDAIHPTAAAETPTAEKVKTARPKPTAATLKPAETAAETAPEAAAKAPAKPRTRRAAAAKAQE